MSVTKETESNDVLVSLHQASESVTPAVEAVSISGDVSNQNGAATDFLEISEFVLEPF